MPVRRLLLPYWVSLARKFHLPDSQTDAAKVIFRGLQREADAGSGKLEARFACAACQRGIDPFAEDFYLEEQTKTNEAGEVVGGGGVGYCDACLTQSGLRPLLGKERLGAD